ncbi:MAG TPA: 2,5-diamino-6-(ribosylamino)-4(3H)-pyrimidinone 5'-phosphate reductase [Candidatus Methanomethylophilaceae archaeon]|nr:2,5-diamino-6-(ribosylamino)-4(3H)-pyrimidinone 5'-phosphate reductase [Candidatus Methanomethylophilaceae archaeon]
MKPYVQINCAMSADGKIAGEDRKQVTISSMEDKERVKQLRRDFDAILVGIGTVIADDPHLTVKDLDYDTNPIRIVLDPNGSTPDSALVLDQRAPTIIVTLESCEHEWDCEEIIRTGIGTIDLKDLMKQLYDMGIDRLLVEGGGETIASFFKEELVDRYTVFVGGLLIGGKKSPTPVDGDGWISEGGIPMVLEKFEKLGNGILMDFVCPP